MNNFLTRTITGALFVTVMVFCIWFSYWTMAGLFFVISILGLWEFYSLLEKTNHHPQKYFGILIAVGFFASLFYFINDSQRGGWSGLNAFVGVVMALLVVVLSFSISFFIELFRNKSQPFVNVALTILGLFYVLSPFSFLMGMFPFKRDSADYIVEMHYVYSPFIILGFFFLMWSNDTFAYLVGRAIGKTKLWERISPKKTWEGFVGGLVLTQAIAYVISIYFTELALLHWLMIGVIVSVFGTLGDLVESMFKRSLGVKDSGGILPGHGGILDRFDGVLLASPFVCTYLLLVR